MGRLICVLMILVGCTNPGPFEEQAFETKGDPIVWQKLGSLPTDSGVYRWVDKESGVAVYAVIRPLNNPIILVQKIGK